MSGQPRAVRTLGAVPPPAPPSARQKDVAGDADSATNRGRGRKPRSGSKGERSATSTRTSGGGGQVATTISLPPDHARQLDELVAVYRRSRAAVIVALHHSYHQQLAVPDDRADPLAASLPDGPPTPDPPGTQRPTVRYIRADRHTWQPVVDAARQRRLPVSGYIRRLLDLHRDAATGRAGAGHR